MPQALNDDVVRSVENAVSRGEIPSEAAKRMFGVSPTRWAQWWRRGVEFYDDEDKSGLEDHDRKCVELVGRVWVAEAKHENDVRKLWYDSLKAGKAGIWQGCSTLLQLRYPDRWRKREMEKAGGKVEAPEEEFRRLAEAKRLKSADRLDDREQQKRARS